MKAGASAVFKYISYHIYGGNSAIHSKLAII